jgi:oligopeptide transport system substrate-binding protein
LNGVTFLPFENPATEEAAFRNGQLHITSSLPLQKIAVYAREEPEVLKIVPDLGNYFYSLNVTKAPFDDGRVRRALSLATDRAVIATQVVRGGKVPATAFTPPGLAGYEANARLRFAPEEARALLAEAGYAGGAGFPAVELVIDSRDHHRVVAEALQQMWARELGVTVRLRNEETRSLIASKRAMNFDLVRGSWNASTYQDPWFFLGPWVTGGLYNEAGWSSARYDALIAEARATVEPEARLAVLRAAEDVLLDELPVLPLYWGTQVFLVGADVEGYVEAPFADRAVKALRVRGAAE